MEKFLIQLLIAVLISSFIAFRAYKRKSLHFSGAVAGFVVMTIHFAVSYRLEGILFAFFLTSSKLTKLGEEKRRINADFKEGEQRNCGIATVLAVARWKLDGLPDKCLDTKESVVFTSLIGGIIGRYSCCNGDTWSSELGVLSDAQPRLITAFKPVRKGTNGGVTVAGLVAAAAAGSVFGFTFLLFGIFTTRCE